MERVGLHGIIAREKYLHVEWHEAVYAARETPLFSVSPTSHHVGLQVDTKPREGMMIMGQQRMRG